MAIIFDGKDVDISVTSVQDKHRIALTITHRSMREAIVIKMSNVSVDRLRDKMRKALIENGIIPKAKGALNGEARRSAVSGM